ncbi:hypothetical protein SBOR_9813 [Sclerotinia borealis F-4128]|uniref:Uncharacterized protein n=1 Tax=Sclerotinia borealis (strain F-4128) TaxID=1432307 RepID=W9C5J0_SCLBF|nr:hypothetical protein SBOR_9813 [Sclerotinia borealis F-4128]
MASPTFGCPNMPVVIKWGDTEQYNYIGAQRHNLRINIHLGTETSPQLIIWFSMTIGITASPDSSTIRTKTLYFVIPASLLGHNENDTCLSLETPNSDRSIDTSTAIREAGISSDHASVSRICFQLHDHGTVFMPPINEHAFTPASDIALQLLVSLRSLSQAKQFWVYTSSEDSCLTKLWKRIDRIREGTFTGDFTTQSVFKRGMVCDKWTNFNNFVRRENPVRRENSVRRENTLHGEQHASEPPPLYIGESQGAGMEREDNDPSYVLDQDLVDSESDQELSLKRKRSYSNISSDPTPSGILKHVTDASIPNSNESHADHQSSRVRFAEPCNEVPSAMEKELSVFIFWVLENHLRLGKSREEVFSDLGGAVSRGDKRKFNEIKSKCMANICVKYVKTGSKWVVRNTV